VSIPKGHPRIDSLKQRELLENGLKKGFVTPTGLIAFGRGEAFDYLLGEATIKPAREAIKASAAMILLSDKTIISVNGNVSALIPKEILQLSKTAKAQVEINIFYPPKTRRERISKHLKKFGINALGVNPSKKISSLSSNRSFVDKNGIWTAQTVLVAIEDGDRTEALKKHGKKIIAIDLNPKSRTAITADITIIDNVTRAFPLLIKEINILKLKKESEIKKILKKFNNKKNLKESLNIIKKNS